MYKYLTYYDSGDLSSGYVFFDDLSMYKYLTYYDSGDLSSGYVFFDDLSGCDFYNNWFECIW
jgi:hypothetical protein